MTGHPDNANLPQPTEQELRDMQADNAIQPGFNCCFCEKVTDGSRHTQAGDCLCEDCAEDFALCVVCRTYTHRFQLNDNNACQRCLHSEDEDEDEDDSDDDQKPASAVIIGEE